MMPSAIMPGPLTVTRRSGSGVETLPSFPIEHVYVLSASILQRSMKETSQIQEVRDLIAQMGVDDEDVPRIVTTYSVGGWDSEDYINALPSLLADMAGLDNAVVLMHGFGNDITPSGPYPGGASTFESRMRSIINQIHDAGHRVILGSVTYRIPPGSNPSSPYNAHIVEPIIRELTPWGWDKSAHKPVYNLYQLTRSEPQRYIISDNVHPNDNGQAQIRALTARAIGGYITGWLRDALAPEYFGKRVVVSFGRETRSFNGINAAITNSVGSTTNGTGGSAHCVRLMSTDGIALNGMRLQADFHSNVNQFGRPTADRSSSITNGVLLDQSIYTANQYAATPARVRITGIPNGITGTVALTSARSGSGARIGLYSVNGSDTQRLDGTASTTRVVTFPFLIDQGEIVIQYGCEPGSGFAYLNGIQIDFD